MKNVNTIHEQVTTNREQWFQYRRTLESNLSTLEALYAAQYDVESPLYHSTPAQTVAAFVESVGYEAAVEIVASLVNRSAWDGRISRRCAEWANTQENSWDEEACSRLSIYTNRIHTAHLDQIAAAMMKYEPTTEPAAEEAQEAAEEAQEESTLDKVAAELEAHKDRSAWGRGVNAYCGHCGSKMNGNCNTSGYVYYECYGKKNLHKDCNKRNLKKEFIEDIVVKD